MAMMGRFITISASGIATAIVIAVTLYGGTVEDPPRHPEGVTTIEGYR